MEPFGWEVENRKRRHSPAYLTFMLVQCVACIVVEVLLFYNITVLHSRYAVALQYLPLASNYADMYT